MSAASARIAVSRAFVLVALALSWALAFAQVPVPELRAPVTDLTGTLTAEQVAALEQRLREFERSKGSQIAILLVPTTQPETIEQYSIRVAEQWQLGRRGVDDGVLLLVARNDRTVRLEVGYGLEGALPDVLANRITDQVIVPRFRDGDFFGGLWEGVSRVIGVIEGEPLPEAQRDTGTSPGAGSGIGAALPLLLMLVFVVAGILRRIFGSFGGATLTGGAAGVLVWILTSILAVSITAALLAFIFALFTGGGGGGRGWTSSRHRGWTGGGFGGWGGGWGGGMGGGGWSGGGGGFGGGGASGRW